MGRMPACYVQVYREFALFPDGVTPACAIYGKVMAEPPGKPN